MIGIVALFVIMGVSAIYLLGNEDSTNMSGGVVLDDSNVINGDGDLKTFVVSSVNFKFVMDGVNNPDIIVNEGDRVRIEFESTDGFHDWVIDEFNAATEKVRPGTPTFVEFVADKKGVYEYYCSIGEHRLHGMVGKFIVE